MLLTRETILSILKSNKPKLTALGVTEIGLFGSYVKNQETKTSDIDLLVDFNPKEENFDNYMAVYDIMEKIFKDKKVELITKNGLSKFIGPKILQEVIYV